MKKYTQYIGYPKDHILMVWFWEILEEFDENMKANFLFFLSGSFSVPFGGFKDFALKIERIPNNKEALPVAHTCFNQLDLPIYDSKEIMKEKLLIALTEGSKGFYIG